MHGNTKTRRQFVKSAMALGSVSVLPSPILSGCNLSDETVKSMNPEITSNRSIIGQYGNWAADYVKNIPALSYRNPEINDLEKWRTEAMAKTIELVAAPEFSATPKVEITASYQYDGLQIEEMQWQLPYGRPTQAILLKPANSSGPLPGIVGLHDHGGSKYFGRRKITRTSDDMHPTMSEHHDHYYSGNAWANELAKMGYVVLVHDTFTFGSRRVLYQDIEGITWGFCSTDGKSDENPEDPKNIEVYNEWAAHHEHIMAKSLFCAGLTWPGVTLAEDKVALDILSSREDVDPDNLGCCGLSGGGLRTDYLGGLDHRIKCAVSVGFMSTWSDFILNKTYTHTWMTYAPLLPKFLDFPEILGLRVPLATMVMSNNEDSLYTLPEMKKADEILASIYAKAGSPERYSGKFYPGGHKFDAEMQQTAFGWFDKWLK